MNKLKLKRQKILIDILYLAMIFTLTSLIANVIELDISLSSQIIMLIGVSFLAKILIVYPITILIVLVVIAWAAFFIIKYKPLVFILMQDKVYFFYLNLLANLNGTQAIIKENRLYLYIIILALISLFTALIVYRMKRLFPLMLVYLAIFLSYWYSFIDNAYYYALIFLFLFLALFGIRKYSLSNVDNPKIFNSWTLTSILYSLSIVALAFFIPKSNDYISLPKLQEEIYNRFPIVEDLRYYKDYDRKGSQAKLFNFSRTGFSGEDSSLGGPLVQSQRKVMTVESNEPLYLRGNVKHIYTGKSWEAIPYSPEEFNLDQDISFLLDSEKETYFSSKSASITFDSFSSITIFTPYKPEKISSDRNFSLIGTNDDILTSTDATYRKEGYSVEYLKPLPYETQVRNRRNKKKEDLLDLDLYLQLPQKIDDEDDFYLVSPEIVISDRTKDLTKSLVEGIDNDYDKAIAIESHLRNNYNYNLNVGELPEDREFVDHFLFQEKEGYCTYYATAMAVMLRLEGIATRYVEGYVVDEKIENNKYQVREKHAHAWVEAFIEPVGWLRFEATPAYDASIDRPDEGEKDEIIPDTEEEESQEDREPDETNESPETPIEDNIVEEDKSLPKNQISWKLILFSLIILALFLILMRIIFRSLKYRRKEKVLASLPKKEKIIHIYKDIIDMLDILGFPILPGETHFDYANRLSLQSEDREIQKIKSITHIFVQTKYSDIDALEEDLLSLVQYRSMLEEKLKDHLGKTTYLYRKYLDISSKDKIRIP